jgi:hypothetical protein
MHQFVTIGNMTNESKCKVVVGCVGEIDDESYKDEKA